MNIIDTIQIKYFRSIWRVRLTNLADVNVFTGGNDIGKSNILRALNLFFNNEVAWQEELDFYRDFSRQRLHTVRQETVKGKQFISVKLWFNRPRSYRKSLPERFAVKRTWDRNTTTYNQDDYLDTAAKHGDLPSSLTTARRSLSQLLNKIQFEYVPAVRDRSYFDHLLERLQGILLTRGASDDDDIAVSAEQLAEQVDDRIVRLQEEFVEATGIHTELDPPTDVTSLFRAFGVSTHTEAEESEDIPLSLRGDGIQGRYVPSVLNYISDGSSKLFIWGFEEPENSLEYTRASDLASALVGRYSSNAQIFVTSHSPAFASIEADNANVYRVFRNDEGVTSTVLVEDVEDEPHGHKLREELGLLEIQREAHQKRLESERELKKTLSKLQDMEQKLAEHEQPIVVVEGKWDQRTLQEAWDRLRNGECPYEVEAATPSGEGGGGGAAAVRGVLASKHLGDYPVVGVFDRDEEGIREFNKLPNFFSPVDEMDGVQKHDDEPIYGVLLPPSDDETKDYAKYDNLCIEFLFPEEALRRETADGHGLVLRNRQARLDFEGISFEIPQEQATTVVEEEDRYLRQIRSGKAAFHREIVPGLDDEHFRNFEALFGLVEELVAEGN